VIRDNSEELPVRSGIAVRDELRLRVEAIEDSEVVAVAAGEDTMNCSNRRYTRASLANSANAQGSESHRDHLRRITSEKA
jgi:hypothetical protein